MASEEVSVSLPDIILTMDEWFNLFENNNAVTHTDKTMLVEFRDSLLKLGNRTKELIQLHENEKDATRKMVLDASITHGKAIEEKIKNFILECCEEKEDHRGYASLAGDATSVTFVNGPPPGKFFRGFFNNEEETEFMIDKIKEENGKIYQVILEHRKS